MMDHLFVVTFRPENVRNIYGRTWSHLLQLLLRPFTEWESIPPSLATYNTGIPFPSLCPLCPSTRNRPPPFFTKPSSWVKTSRRTKGEYSKSPVAVRHDGRIGLRSGWDISLASSTDLCSTTSSIRTPPQRVGLFRILWTVWAAGQNGIWPIASPSARKSELPNDSSFPMGRFGRLATRPSHLAVPTPSRGPTRPSCSVCGSRAVSRFRGCALRRHRQVEALESMHHTAL